MAAAEARAAWQRAAKHSLVQEDAERTPKLPCFTNGLDNPKSGFGFHRPETNMSDDIKWWLHLQPGFVHERDLTHEQFNALETEVEALSPEFTDETAKFCGDVTSMEDHSPQSDIKRNAFSCAPQPLMNDLDSKASELKAVYNNNSKALPENDTGELSYPENRLIALDSFSSLESTSREKLSSEFESNLIGVEKAEPWWHMADKDELASFVAQKSLEHVENCDLPQPHMKNFRRGPFCSPENFSIYGFLVSSLDKNGNPTFVNMKEKQGQSDDSGFSLNASDGPLRNHDYGTCTNTKNKDLAESDHVCESNASKAQLLAALHHSQTRARKAEEEAQKLQTEKAHIIKLFFKQTSHLFAYKHWLHLLQLENLFFQRQKSYRRPVSVLFPVELPWVPRKVKGQGKRGSRKQRLPRHRMSRSAVVFALGLSFAGVGMLLGCTMGWLFSAV